MRRNEPAEWLACSGFLWADGRRIIGHIEEIGKRWTNKYQQEDASEMRNLADTMVGKGFEHSGQTLSGGVYEECLRKAAMPTLLIYLPNNNQPKLVFHVLYCFLLTSCKHITKSYLNKDSYKQAVPPP